MNIIATCSRQPWNKGKLVGQKAPLRLRDIWAIRVRLQIAERTRDLALFDLAIDSKLRACDLTKLRVRDVAHGEHVSSRTMVMQQKRSGQCSLRSLSKHGQLSRPGYIRHNYAARTAFFLAGCIPQTIYPLVNTLVSSKAG
ncbi:hypothetical protein SAMN05444065_1243 [Pseudomonas syringae]|uniref:Integrase n=1 Tax=Pseudomonas syringae TaxID=317 RepID=A0AB38C0D0_PSESX|nr:hypothetical protein SAMN05444065_1243 [Pseudomonas syringae]SFO85507.1 hypothetical protein SAMN05444063_1253 [Pseudomonas syringae]